MRKQSALFWGIALLLLGALMLAGEMGIRLPGGDSLSSLFFPLLLLFFGGWILLGAFRREKAEAEEVSLELQGATSAHVKIKHGAGEIKLHGGAAGGELMRGTFIGGLDKKISREGDSLRVQLRSAYDMGFLFGATPSLDWDAAFSAEIPLDLDLNLGASKSLIDLRDLTVTRLDLDVGASETEVYLSPRGRYSADIDCGAASLTVRVPEGLAARIRAAVVAGDCNVNTARFPRRDGVYQSPDFDSAANAVEMTIDAGAASVRIL